MILTDKILKAGCSLKGAWSSDQLYLFGLEWPLEKGWKLEIIGQSFEQKTLVHFIYLKNRHLRKKYPKALIFTLAEAEKRLYELLQEEDTTDPIDEFFYATQGL